VRLNTKIFSSVSTKSFVFGFVILMACAAFVFTGFGSLNPGNLFGLDPNTAAQVGSEKIDMQQFSAVISSQLSADTPPEQRRALAQQVIQQMIQEKVLAEQAKKIGWLASDSEMTVLIKSVPQFQNPQTKQFDIQLFKNYVASQQMSELSFYAFLKQQLEIQKMRNLLYLPSPFPSKLAETQNKINNTEFNLQYAIISIPDATLKTKISEQAKKYAEDKANQSNLNELFQNSKNQFQQKAQVKAQSILISYKTAQRAQGEALKRTQDDAKNLVNQIESKLKSGSDFSTLASETNDDLSAKNNKGNIGFVDETNIDPKSAQAVLALTSQNPLSGIIETPFGYRIFKFVEGKPAISKTFDDVKLQLAEQLLGNQVKQKFDTDLQKDINDAITAKNISKLNTILSENKISWHYISKLYKVSDPFVNELGMASNLAQNVFSLKNPGDIIPKTLDFGTKKAIIKLVSRSTPTTTSEQLEALKKQMMASTSQEFATSSQQYLLKSYEKSDKIKINPALLN
jgi:peptidyl-prolyl cis-trans isomerase D